MAQYQGGVLYGSIPGGLLNGAIPRRALIGVILEGAPNLYVAR